MGLLDIVGGVLGGQAGPQGQPGGQDSAAALITAVIGMLAGGGAQGGGLGSALGGSHGGAQGGGLGALIERFRANGMGDIANSWVSSGPNMPLSGDQFSQVLGQQQMSDLASRFGLSTGDLSAQMSQALPQAVDRLTPEGRLPEGGLADLLSMLTGR